MKSTRRKFSRRGNAVKRSARQLLEDRIGATIFPLLLEHDPTIRRPALQLASHAAGLIASTLAVQTQSIQRTLPNIENQLETMCHDFVRAMVDAAQASQEEPDIYKPTQAPLNDEGRPDAGLTTDWAGPVAGPTLLERHYGISRSTLFRWQKRNEVVALRTGGKKFVFPLRQFVDGRPIDGLDDILKMFADSRAAWQWLIKPNSDLSGEAPVNLLTDKKFPDVAHAARLRTY